MIIKLKSEVWNALKTCVAAKGERYYLQGIYFDIPNKCAVATDGWTLLRAPFEDCEPKENSEEAFILDLNGKSAPRGGTVCVDTMQKQISFMKKRGAEDRTEVYKVIDARFPDYERIIPDPDRLQDSFKSIRFNPHLIARTFGALEGRALPVARLRSVSDDGNDALVIELPGHPDITFIVMPCRS